MKYVSGGALIKTIKKIYLSEQMVEKKKFIFKNTILKPLSLPPPPSSQTPFPPFIKVRIKQKSGFPLL